MEAKFSNRVKEVISLSREEALRLGHDYIGTEHLLLGVIREGEGVAISLLKKLGISLEDLMNLLLCRYPSQDWEKYGFYIFYFIFWIYNFCFF